MIRPPLAVACWLAWGVALAAPAAHAPAGSPLAAAGAALYNRGVLHDGTPLVGERDNAIPLSGAEAGCSNCHRRSALGTTEGRTVIPPIAGPYLFEAQAQRGAGQPPPYVAGIRSLRTPYTRDTLARALRDGVDPDGRALSYLMPRYALGEHDLDALIAHLKSIEPRRSPGVSTTELHFATILTPDTDPARRAAVLDVIRHFFTDRNAAPRGLDRQLLAPSGKELAAKSMFKVNRTWVLHVWEPSGPPQTWNAQLARLYAAEPVFAVISGYWGDHPEPVRDFCEQQRVPCLFPNVDRPPETGDADFYTLYFSRGVALEADLIAAGLVKEVATAGSGLTVRQIYRKGGAGEEAARALATRLKAAGIGVSSRALAAEAPLEPALREPAANERYVLWLRRADLARLPADAPAPTYASAILAASVPADVPAAWRSRIVYAYPYDLPERRRVRVDYARGWFRIRNIAVVDEKLQADTYLACGLLSETAKHLVDAFVPDYLLERFEDTLEHRVLTGYYPRLSLAPGQRYASKGGFLVREDGDTLKAVGDWQTP